MISIFGCSVSILVLHEKVCRYITVSIFCATPSLYNTGGDIRIYIHQHPLT
jgi:hypothetical protein